MEEVRKKARPMAALIISERLKTGVRASIFHAAAVRPAHRRGDRLAGLQRIQGGLHVIGGFRDIGNVGGTNAVDGAFINEN